MNRRTKEKFLLTSVFWLLVVNTTGVIVGILQLLK